MREPWRSFLYVVLVGSLPLAFWYALWPLRQKLAPKVKPSQQDLVDHEGLAPDESAS